MLHTLLYLLALFALSTAANWAKLNQMPVEVLGFYRLGIAGLFLALWILITKPLSKPKFDVKIFWGIASGFFFFLHLWTYIYAARNTPVSSMMIIFSSNPIWASMGAIAFFGEKLTSRLLTSYLLAFCGVYLLVAHNLNLTEGSFYGNISALMSAVLYAAYMITGKKARQFHDNTHFALINYTTCALFFGIFALGNGSHFTGYTSISWVSVLGLVFLPTFLGHFSFTYLVKHMNLSLLTCGKLIEPVIASIIAYFIFCENISPNAWIAFALTGASVLVLFAPNSWLSSTR